MLTGQMETVYHDHVSDEKIANCFNDSKIRDSSAIQSLHDVSFLGTPDICENFVLNLKVY